MYQLSLGETEAKERWGEPGTAERQPATAFPRDLVPSPPNRLDKESNNVRREKDDLCKR